MPASRTDLLSVACGTAVEAVGSSRRTAPSAAGTAPAAPGCPVPARRNCSSLTWTWVTVRPLILVSDATPSACQITAALY